MFFITKVQKEDFHKGRHIDPGYYIKVFKDFNFNSRSVDLNLEDGQVTFLNKVFVEKFCTIEKGASAKAIRVLFGE